MNIAYVLPALRTGGAERMTAGLASLFADAGHQVTIFVGYPSDGEAPVRERLDPRVTIEYIRTRRRHTIVRYASAAMWTWRHRSRLCSFDVVHCHLTYGAFVATLVGIFRNVKGKRRPAIIETYHAVGMRIPRFKRWVHSLMAARRDFLVLMAIDPYWTRFTTRHQNLATRIVLNGAAMPDIACIDASARRAYRASLGIPPEGGVVVGTVGVLRPDRQPACFIRILSRLGQEFGEQVHWVFAGDGPEREKLETIARDKGLSRQVHFSGFVNDVRYPLSIMDLYFTLNVGDVCGIAAMEAALAGLPIIAVQLVRGRVASPGDWIWSNDDPDAVAAEAIRLLRDPVELTALADRQQRHAQIHHSIEVMGRSYRDLYDTILGVAPQDREVAPTRIDDGEPRTRPGSATRRIP